MFSRFAELFRRQSRVEDVYKGIRAKVTSGDMAGKRGDDESDVPLKGDPLLTDATLSGWFNRSERELFTGFGIEQGDRVLDVGCGDGGYSHFCGLMGGELILADADSSSLALARERLSESLPAEQVTCVVTSGTDLPFPDACVNKVLAMEVLEHLEEPEKLLAEIVRVGRPGARYLISVPDPRAEEMQKQVAPEYVFRKPNHIHIFQRGEFENMLRAAGLSVEQREYYGFFWSLWWLLYWSTGRDLGDPSPRVTEAWTRTWAMLLRAPKGEAVKSMLDELLPKSQVIVATKPSSAVTSATS